MLECCRAIKKKSNASTAVCGTKLISVSLTECEAESMWRRLKTVSTIKTNRRTGLSFMDVFYYKYDSGLRYAPGFATGRT